LQPIRRGIAQARLLGAAGRVGFRRINIGDPDLLSVDPEGIPVHNTIEAAA
jgi:hypothetical protein